MYSLRKWFFKHQYHISSLMVSQRLTCWVLNRERVLEFHEESGKNTREQDKQHDKGAPSVTKASYNVMSKASEGMSLFVCMVST
jgi:hypothetical protein